MDMQTKAVALVINFSVLEANITSATHDTLARLRSLVDRLP